MLHDSMKTAILSPDYLTQYRYPLLAAIYNNLQNLGYSIKVVAPMSTINNLSFYCPDSRILKSVINSTPVFFSKFYIISSRLLFSFFQYKPNFLLLWGEINRLDTWFFLLLKLLVNPRLHIVLWTHGIYGRENIIVLKLRLLLAKLSSHVFLYDYRALNFYLKHGFDASKFSVIGNLIPGIEKFKPLKRSQDMSSLNLLYVGRLSLKKKFHILFDTLKSSTLPFHIHLTVISPDYPSSFTYCLGDHTVSCHPALYDFSQLSVYFTKSHFCICPDNVGLFCLSSLKAGIPFISHLNYPFHGPEACSLNINNTIEVPYPVTKQSLLVALTRAFSSLHSTTFSDPDTISSSIPAHFTSLSFCQSVIADYFRHHCSDL